MSFMDGLTERMQGTLGPLANWFSQNKYVQALSQGFMMTMPLTLGAAVIAVLVNIPLEAWQGFLANSGMLQAANDLMSVTMSMLGIYVVLCIAYQFMKAEGKEPITGCVLAVGAYFIMAPLHNVELVEGSSEGVLQTSVLGSNGIFVAIILGLIVPKFYNWLMSKNLTLKLPDGVPPMVAASLSPTFAAMIIFVVLFFAKWGISLTPYGDLFNLVSTVVTAPIMNVGTSPWSLILVYTFMNLMWFFGVHPSPIMGAYMPIMIAVSMENIGAYMAGQPLPNLAWIMAAQGVYLGGTGNTLGLCVAMLFARSEKYKALRKITIPANIFNINEPMIFGVPLVFNPIYFLPMVFSGVVAGTVTTILGTTLNPPLNPTIQLPWVMPGFIGAFLAGGFTYLLVWLAALAVHFVCYLPFFLMDDNQEYQNELKGASEAA